MFYSVKNCFLRCVLGVCFGTLRPRGAQSFLGVRHVQMILLFFGLLIAYAMRVNMSIAIVAMTDRRNESYFDWSMQTQSVILSSFFWGYIVLQIPGGELAKRFGGKILLAIAVGINSILVLGIPMCAYHGGWKLVCTCRVIQGLSQGIIFPSIHSLLGKWVPLEEKSRLGTFAYAGSHLGTALQLISAGYVAEYWGWPMIFYSIGIPGLVWTIVYIYLGSSSPQTSTFISIEERQYIDNSLGGIDDKTKETPWKSMLTAKPFWALTLVHCGQNWGFWTLLAEMPSYMKKVLGMDIKSNGILSAMPYLSMYILSFPFGIILDYSLKRRWLNLSASRKLSNSIGFYGAAVALIAMSFVPCSDISVASTLLTVAVGINAGHITGFLLVHIDMAPNFAGTMMGVTNCIANIVSIIAPLVAGALLKDETDPNEWSVVFYLTAAIYIITNTVFILYGTSERQPWNSPGDKENKHKQIVCEQERNIEMEH